MAWNIGATTDRVYWVKNDIPVNLGAVAFWIRTTSTTVGACLSSLWNGSSRNGWGMVLNNGSATGKIICIGYNASSNQLGANVQSTTAVNDGNWHHAVFNYNRNASGTNSVWIDGVQEASYSGGGSWGTSSNGFFLMIGDNVDSFWGTAFCDMMGFAHWQGSNLDAAQIAALAKGFSPARVKRDGLDTYAPLVRDVIDRSAPSRTANITGGSVAAHGRAMPATI